MSHHLSSPLTHSRVILGMVTILGNNCVCVAVCLCEDTLLPARGNELQVRWNPHGLHSHRPIQETQDLGISSHLAPPQFAPVPAGASHTAFLLSSSWDLNGIRFLLLPRPPLVLVFVCNVWNLSEILCFPFVCNICHPFALTAKGDLE